jgi:hypothetical protein
MKKAAFGKLTKEMRQFLKIYSENKPFLENLP